MRKRTTNHKSRITKKGFTLIELIIVIAVISILIGIALPRFKGMREEGLVAQAKGELRTLQVAVETYYIHNSSYPTAGDTWQTALTGDSPQIIGTALIDPFSATSAQYGYALDTNSKYYVIYSAGPGATAGTCTISTAGAVTEATVNPIFVSGSDRDATGP